MPATMTFPRYGIVAPKGRSYKIALQGAASHKIAPKGRSNKIARLVASHRIAPRWRSNEFDAPKNKRFVDEK